MDEIAAKVRDVIEHYGPRSVALYFGTGIAAFFPLPSVAAGWMQAIGSRMIFSSNTIDKPGAQIAQAAHGTWLAGHPCFESAEAWVLVGVNPVISRSGGFPPNNPGTRMKEAVTERGMKLIVIDPRVTQSAQRAHIHLQCKPGEDPSILAAMIHIIIGEKLFDAAFVAENVTGLRELERHVAPFTPQYVASRAGVPREKLIEAARIYGTARYAAVGCGTGPSFAMHGGLTEYLSSCLMSLCGNWSREGSVVCKPNVLMPQYTPKAQPLAPFPAWGFGEQLRVRGLGESASGMPTGALADEILLEGAGQVRVLFNLAGNPMMAWPDQRKAARALNSLELLVTNDYEMGATARLSHYVIAPKLTLETPCTTAMLENIKYVQHLRGIEAPYAQYTPRIVAPPRESDLIEDWELFYGLAQRMGLQIDVTTTFGLKSHAERPPDTVSLDMDSKPSSEQLLEMIHRTSRVPLAEVKKHAHGRIFHEIREVVQPRDPACTARLDVANPHMMSELQQVLSECARDIHHGGAFPFLLIPRRVNHLMNSAGHTNPKLVTGKRYNPAFVHPDDLQALGIPNGTLVQINSPHGEIIAIVEMDEHVRRGVVSMTHGYGRNPGEDENPHEDGCNVGRLMSDDSEYDPITGIPRMGAVPIAIRAARI
jgi:anaerobic selenocysteine-containing dehydrogenase